MIHLIKNYYAAPNNMGFTLLKEKNRKDNKKGNTTYETLGYCGNFEEVIILLKRRAVNDRLSEESMELSDALQVIQDTTKEIMDAIKGVTS